MNDDELKRLWREQKFNPAQLPQDDQVKWMRIRLKNMDRAYLFADVMIIGLGTLLILYFAWTFLRTPLLVARIGIVIIIGTLVFDIWKPIGARRKSPCPPADAPVTQWLRHELEKVRAESELKRNMLWWYFLPFWIGGMIFTWGLDTPVSSRIFFSAVLTGLNALLYVGSLKLNRYTRRKACLPLKAELESLLQSEPSPTGPP